MNNVLEGMIWFLMVRQKLHNAFQGSCPTFCGHLLHVCTLTSRIACRSRHVSKKYGSIRDPGFHPSGNAVVPFQNKFCCLLSGLIGIRNPQ